MSKRALIAKYFNDIRASYWFLPTILALLAVVLAQVTLYVDHTFQILPEGWRTTQVEGARSTLALISQSMIGVAGVMFSMTIVAVSFASGNFGPRLIGNFMRDRGNQWSLGILIATFVYTLLILRAVQSQFGPEDNGAAFVPHLSLAIALGLTAIAVMSMIYFVHHIPEIINVSNITAELGARLQSALKTYISRDEDHVAVDAGPFPSRDADEQFFLANSGYIQTWNRQRLAELAQEHSLFISIDRVAGDFVSPSTPILNVWTTSSLSDDLVHKLKDCFALGSVPTEAQNPEFIVAQLVEMVARAMSPGVNDPFTAINCINWMYVGLSTAANYEGGIRARPQGRLRYRTISFEAILKSAVGNIAPYVRDDRIVSAHLAQILERLQSETDNATALALLRETEDRLSLA
ncbi:DUF2254 domain-containing protein [Sulfitobacter sp. JB4-11]|uniref:DUF2254 domain-containing protein n=1 Tax=Sulfitobacter rhodophyticola TaxID=3238304 RepID=UPI0035153EA6